MAKPDFEPNQAFFDTVLRSPPVEVLVDEAAERALAAAKASAPEVTGGYKQNLHIEHHESKYRRSARVVGDLDYSMTVESRTGNLARAVKAAKQ